MDELALLKPKLARLKLSGMLDTLSERLSQALAEKWSYTQFLDILLTDEAERRDFKQLGRRLTKSGLAPDKTLETFDFSFNPRIHAPTLRELATCRFVQRSENVFFVGPSGVGKSHAAQALGPRRLSQGICGHLRAHQRVARLDPRRSWRRHLPAPAAPSRNRSSSCPGRFRSHPSA